MKKVRAAPGPKRMPAILVVAAAAILLVSLIPLFAATGKVFQTKTLASVERVGMVGEGKSRSRYIGLANALVKIDLPAPPLLAEAGPARVARGLLLSTEKTLKFDAGRGYQESVLSFRVNRTNGYGILLVRLNGYIIWKGQPSEGDLVEVDIAKFSGAIKPGTNVLKIATTSSGWIIWSPSEYLISDVTMQQNVKKDSRTSFDFEIDEEELRLWMMGRVVFTVSSTKPTSELILEINNETVWKGVPAAGPLPVMVDFSRDVTNVRKLNTLSFRVQNESSYALDQIHVIVFTSVEGKSNPSVEFSVGEHELEGLKLGRLKGRISFNVSNVAKEGNLNVVLFGADEASSRSIMDEPLEAGMASIEFQDTDVTEGKNHIQFKSEGIYYIESLDIAVASE